MLFIKVRFLISRSRANIDDCLLVDPDSCVAEMLVGMEARSTRSVSLVYSRELVSD